MIAEKSSNVKWSRWVKGLLGCINRLAKRDATKSNFRFRTETDGSLGCIAKYIKFLSDDRRADGWNKTILLFECNLRRCSLTREGKFFKSSGVKVSCDTRDERFGDQVNSFFFRPLVKICSRDILRVTTIKTRHRPFNRLSYTCSLTHVSLNVGKIDRLREHRFQASALPNAHPIGNLSLPRFLNSRTCGLGTDDNSNRRFSPFTENSRGYLIRRYISVNDRCALVDCASLLQAFSF